MKPTWSSSQLKHLKRLKRAALRKHSKYRSDTTRIAYSDANEAYSRLNDHLYNAQQIQIQSRLKSDPKSFWRYVNDQRNQTGLPASMSNGVGVDVCSTTEIADMFRTQFRSVFTDEVLTAEDINTTSSTIPRLPNPGFQVSITSDTVICASRKLKSSTGCGPDCIPSLLLKRCATSLATPLAGIFKSLTTEEFPACWKDSFVFPVYKKGCRTNVANYRGIASLSAISKLFEKLIHECARHILKNQHGCMPKRSTYFNLATFT